MLHILLLGAGFSRNWGGWLANEVFEYLLGCPEILGNVHLRRALWNSKSDGGFEQALSLVQADRSLGQTERDRAIQAFDIALIRMFVDLNAALLEVDDLEFPTAQPNTVKAFLARFDAIFTLNQDLLLEHRYMDHGPSYGRWRGAQLPGLTGVPGADGRIADSWVSGIWTDSGQTLVDQNLQPIYKLHGSTNWRTTVGDSLLVLGAAKTQVIRSSRLLSSYADIFDQSLCRHDVRLMVIGYGFGDAHIEALFEQSLIGASRRTLREIFGADVVEHKKLERFFG